MAGLALLSVTVVVPSAGAVGGNNGTVKIDGVPTNGNDHGQGNNPHVGCVFHIDWSGFDPIPTNPSADVSFDAQPPTGNVNLLTDHVVFPNPPGNGTASKTYDISAQLQAAGLTPHKQGYHISVSINTTDSNGSDFKSKTYWVQGCFDPTLSAATCTAAPNSGPQITLSITNNGQDDTFDIVQDGNAAGSKFVAAGATETVDLPQTQGVDSVITVTSQTDPNISSTITVKGVNCPAPATGTIRITKVLDGTGTRPASTDKFTFHVDCGAPVAGGLNYPDPNGQDPQISPSQGAVTVAEKVTFGTQCTVTETGYPAGFTPDSTKWTVTPGGATATTSPPTVPTATGTPVNGAATVSFEFSNKYDPPIVIVNNPQPDVSSITLQKKLTGGAEPADTTKFNFSVSCTDPNTVYPQGQSPMISASQGAVTVASNVEVNTQSCTITETNTKSADSTSYTVNGGSSTAGNSVKVTPASTTAVAVAFTNEFDPAPTTTAPPPTTAPPTTAGPQVLPEVVTVPPPTVLGEVIAREPLARTGADHDRRIVVAIALLMLGLVLIGSSKRLEYVMAQAGGGRRQSHMETPRSPQHAASTSFVSRAWLSVAVSAAALMSWAKRR